MNDLKHKPFFRMFVEQLQDIYSAESQLAVAMPKLLKAIATEEIKQELGENPENQKNTLKRIFEILEENPEGEFCYGMQGLIAECEKVAKEDLPPLVKDAAIIAEMQKIKHYEIASYGALFTFAKHLGLETAEDLLAILLHEERDADKNLTNVAEGGWFKEGINAEAAK